MQFPNPQNVWSITAALAFLLMVSSATVMLWNNVHPEAAADIYQFTMTIMNVVIGWVFGKAGNGNGGHPVQ